jgi:hypothetical protein
VVACSLDPTAERERLAEWKEVLQRAASREEITGGVRYTFPASPWLEQRVRALAGSEKLCCSFFAFDISTVDDRLELAVAAPREGQDALRFIFSS